MGVGLVMSRTSLYVPVLRSRKAEFDALRQVGPDVRSLIAPLIEVTPSYGRELSGLPPRGIARELTLYSIGAAGLGEAYLDLGLLLDDPEAELICEELQDRLLRLKALLQPVFRVADFGRKGIKRAGELLRRNGAAFRVTRTDYESPELSDVDRFMRLASLEPASVDLLVDCQVIADGQPMRGTASRLESKKWRS